MDRPAPPTYGDDHILLNYWQTNDYSAGTNDNGEGRILFGSLGDTYPFPRWLASWRLRSVMSEIYPKFANVRFDYIWNGSCFKHTFHRVRGMAIRSMGYL